jgi:hypothetical protein
LRLVKSYVAGKIFPRKGTIVGFKNFPILLRLTLKIITESRPFSEKKNGNCRIFADSCWEMLLKAIGQAQGTAKSIGKPLGNTQVHTAQRLTAKMSLFPFILSKRCISVDIHKNQRTLIIFRLSAAPL